MYWLFRNIQSLLGISGQDSFSFCVLMVHVHLAIKVLSRVSPASGNRSSSGEKRESWDPKQDEQSPCRCPGDSVRNWGAQDHSPWRKKAAAVAGGCGMSVISQLNQSWGYKLRSAEFCCFSGTAMVTLSWKGEGWQIKIIITSKRLTMLGTCSNSMRSQVERKPCRTWVPFTQTPLSIPPWPLRQGELPVSRVTTHPGLSSTTLAFIPIILAAPFTLKSVLVWTLVRPPYLYINSIMCRARLPIRMLKLTTSWPALEVIVSVALVLLPWDSEQIT